MTERGVVERLRESPAGFLSALVRRVYRVMVDRFARNNILTYASAMALQLLTALIPLALLAFLLLGQFGEQSVWRRQLAPGVSDRLSAAAFHAVDTVAEGLISSPHPHWLALAVAIALWEVSGAVRTAMGALNRIFELEETRPLPARFGRSFAIAAAVASCTLGAMLVASRGGGWVDLGAAQPLWTIVRWLAVLFLLWLVLAIVFRFAPNAREDVGWVTLGGAIVIVAWIGASLAFAWWVTSAADYRTPFGTAIALLTLVGYLYTSSIVFLVGAQVDRLLLEQAEPGQGPLDGLSS